MVLLSEELKSHTAVAHTQAEEASFVKELMAGNMDQGEVGNLLAQSLVIYRALESALARFAGHPQLGPFVDARLERVPALERDMDFHFGPDWEEQLADGRIHIVPAAKAYADRLGEQSEDAVEFLLAHHYVRYLGDLSGGQIIQRLVQRHYGTPDAGLNFYAFPLIEKPKVYKDQYRARLDTTDFSRPQKDRILHHAAESFEMNRSVFLDLADYRESRLPAAV
ncbi:biliverdin-producing heme oxygenase [Arthrobacter luteolus]|uniref:biliverdin-producing heme oxygenase n=1 Tax=Arthrobacter luteolus TaxID=98672 RepID=UPI000832C9F2|nr:biliverdin-producing heme oxygenase [Arthrobacter luteolus]